MSLQGSAKEKKKFIIKCLIEFLLDGNFLIFLIIIIIALDIEPLNYYFHKISIQKRVKKKFIKIIFVFLVDVWSIGCIFAELLRRKPLLTGTNSLNQNFPFLIFFFFFKY